jgi:hypothetical protein
MLHMVEDPTRATCLSFEDPEWEFLRQSMVNAHQGDQPFTLDDAAQRMKETWARENEHKLTTWNTQLKQDQAAQDELDRVTQEEEEAHRIQQDKEAEEQRKEAEKKRPKLGGFDPTLPVERWIKPRPSSYAIHKLNGLEYLELDYFTLRVCKDASADSHKSISLDTMAIMQLGDSFTFRPLSTLRPSKHIRNNEDLTWEEMLDAKNLMLHFMAKSRLWPTTHAEALATFFINLELHPRKSQVNGKKALLLYQSHVRREWFDTLKNGVGFNIVLIQDNLLRAYAEELNDTIQERDNAGQDREIDQVCVFSLSPSPVQYADYPLPFPYHPLPPTFPLWLITCSSHAICTPANCTPCHLHPLLAFPAACTLAICTPLPPASPA